MIAERFRSDAPGRKAPVSLIRLIHLIGKSKSSELFAFARFRSQVSQVSQVKRPLNGTRNENMATKAIKVQVDERLAGEIADKAVKAWHATNYSNGKRRVYVTFEEVKTVGA